MILFTIIFFVMVIAIGASAVLGFSFYLRRKTKQLKEQNQTLFTEPPRYRPLFAPTEEDTRALELEEKLREKAKAEDEIRQAKENKIKLARDFQNTWQDQPNKGKTIELLRLAATSEDSETFSETARGVLNFWNDKKIDNLSAQDLADLLDSHLRTLPQQERASGILFWLKQEIESLRRNSEVE
jgi:hypothetical protein